jgi:hypothetical protein
MGRGRVVVATVIVLTSLLMTGVGTAVARGGSGTTYSGTTTCTVTGKLTFKPPLAGLDGGTSKATVTATLSHCTHAKKGAVTLTGGKLKGLSAFVTPDNCTNTALSQTPPPLAGGSVAWKASGPVTSSSAISFPSGSAAVVTSSTGVTYLQVAYQGGSVGGGSFANSGRVDMTVTSTENDAQLQDKCTSTRGLSAVAFTGSAVV